MYTGLDVNRTRNFFGRVFGFALKIAVGFGNMSHM